MRKNVLVVAQQIELRARIARVLHSAGYGAELAGNQKRICLLLFTCLPRRWWILLLTLLSDLHRSTAARTRRSVPRHDHVVSLLHRTGKGRLDVGFGGSLVDQQALGACVGSPSYGAAAQ